jgi:hypothetical protein
MSDEMPEDQFGIQFTVSQTGQMKALQTKLESAREHPVGGLTATVEHLLALLFSLFTQDLDGSDDTAFSPVLYFASFHLMFCREGPHDSHFELDDPLDVISILIWWIYRKLLPQRIYLCCYLKMSKQRSVEPLRVRIEVSNRGSTGSLLTPKSVLDSGNPNFVQPFVSQARLLFNGFGKS